MVDEETKQNKTWNQKKKLQEEKKKKRTKLFFGPHFIEAIRCCQRQRHCLLLLLLRGNQKDGEQLEEEDTFKKEEERKNVPFLSHSVIVVELFVAVNTIFKGCSFPVVVFEEKRNNKNYKRKIQEKRKKK
jgi:hypothetical protein